MPLSEGELPYMPFIAKVIPAPLQRGTCPKTPQDLMDWFAKATVEVRFDGVAFGYSAGTLEDATPDVRNAPRLVFDDQGRYLGTMVWDTNLGVWTTGARIGELKTLVRTADTLEEDLAGKNLGAGWYLCDGNQAPLPDLTAVDGFFQGSTPNWSVYTVGYLGF